MSEHEITRGEIVSPRPRLNKIREILSGLLSDVNSTLEETDKLDFLITHIEGKTPFSQHRQLDMTDPKLNGAGKRSLHMTKEEFDAFFQRQLREQLEVLSENMMLIDDALKSLSEL